MFNFKKLIRKEPNYRVIELEAENNKFKDELIESLKTQIEVLNQHIELLKLKSETPVEIPTSTPETKPRISTSTQLARFMEEASLIRKKERENVKVS